MPGLKHGSISLVIAFLLPLFRVTPCQGALMWSDWAQKQCDTGKSPIQEIRTLSLTRDSQAKTLLNSALTILKPVMCQHQLSVGRLHEFLPLDSSLLGLNVNQGLEMKVRLRRSDNPSEFVSLEQLLGTLVHELSHNLYTGHGIDFWTMYKSIQESCSEFRGGRSCEDKCLIPKEGASAMGELWTRAGQCTAQSWSDKDWILGLIIVGGIVIFLVLLCVCGFVWRRWRLAGRNLKAKSMKAKRPHAERVDALRGESRQLEEAIRRSLQEPSFPEVSVARATTLPRTDSQQHTLNVMSSDPSVQRPPAYNPDARASRPGELRRQTSNNSTTATEEEQVHLALQISRLEVRV